MASKSFLNVNATIAMAHGMAESILEKFGYCFTCEVFSKLEAVQEKAMSAFAKWPEKIDNPGFRKVSEMISHFSDLVNETAGDLTAITSTVISMLEGLKEVLMDMRSSRAKIVAISELLEAVIHVHSAFDPELQFDDGYVAAALLQNKWVKILEAA